MIELYGHPFAAFAWKALIALYERDVPFRFRMLGPDQPENAARLAELSPTGQFPVVVDGERVVVESNIVIEYLDLHHGTAPPMVPADARAALEARMMADVFDDYVSRGFQGIVSDALRDESERSPRNIADARLMLDKSYAWLDRKLQGRTWAAGEAFTIADCAAAPALFYADWVHPIPARYAALAGLRARLLARPSVARVVDEARPYRSVFPPGAPDRD